MSWKDHRYDQGITNQLLLGLQNYFILFDFELGISLRQENQWALDSSIPTVPSLLLQVSHMLVHCILRTQKHNHNQRTTFSCITNSEKIYSPYRIDDQNKQTNI